MTHNGKHLYFYLGWNGLILALNFDFHGKNHDFQIDLTHYSAKLEDD